MPNSANVPADIKKIQADEATLATDTETLAADAGASVAPPPPSVIPLAVATIASETVTIGKSYTFPLSVTGGAKPYAATAAGLTPGFGVSATAISGVPTTAGINTFTVTVTDASSPVQSKTTPSVTWTTVAASVPPPPPGGSMVPNAPATISGVTVPQTLVWHDEFTEGAVNFAYWNVINGVTDNSAKMLASNVSFGSDGIHLNWTGGTGSFMTTGTQFNSGAPYNITGTGFTISPNGGGTHGGTGPVYFEWEATFPTTGGKIANWPALWTGGLYPAGEQDVAEGLGGELATTVHYNSYSQSDRLGAMSGVSSGTFGLLWTTSGQYVVHNGTVIYSGAIPASEMANAPQCVLIENGGATSGSYGGPALNGAEVVIRYVRVFQG